MPTPSPVRLRSIALSGARAVIRRVAFAAITITALVAAVGYVLPAHRLVEVRSSGHWLDLAAQRGESAFHSNFDDGGPLPLLVLPAVAAIAYLLRRKRLGAGTFAGIAAAGGAVAAIIPVVLVHLLSRYEEGYGEHLFAAGVLGLFFSGSALFLAEPVLFVLERRRLVRASRPAPLPVAVAMRG